MSDVGLKILPGGGSQTPMEVMKVELMVGTVVHLHNFERLRNYTM